MVTPQRRPQHERQVSDGDDEHLDAVPHGDAVGHVWLLERVAAPRGVRDHDPPNLDAAAPVRVGADVWLKQSLALTGLAGHLALVAGVIVAGGIAFWIDRRESIPLRSDYFAAIAGESAVYAVVVALLASHLVGFLFAAAPAPVGDVWTQLALSIGAGIYEELVFRVLLVGGLAWGLRRMLRDATAAYVVAAVVGAFLFSAVHYVGAYGDAFTLDSFTFRFVFGLALNGLYLWRGFGIAAWTHALYDVFLVVNLL